MKAIFKYIDKLTMQDPKVIKHKIKVKFSLSKEEAENIYCQWKKEFLKHGYKGK